MRPLAAFALTAFLLTRSAPAQPSDEAEPVFRSETRIVEITLLASDRRGQPITDLTAAEFEVLDDGQPQTILDLHRVGTRGDVERGTADLAFRHTLILIDALNTDFRDQTRLRKAVGEVLEGVDAREERVAVFLFNGELYMLHDFLDPPEALLDLAKGIAGDGSFEPVRRLGREWASWDGMFRQAASWPALLGSGSDFARAAATLNAFSDVARGTDGIPGQKNLIWISSGFMVGAISSYCRTMLPGTFGPDGMDVLCVGMRNPSVSHKDFSRVLHSLNGYNWSVYPVDVAGLSLDPRSSDRIGVMKTIAKTTGGKGFYNRNDLDRQVQDALADSGTGYVIAFSPSGAAIPGKQHKIKIRTVRSGVRLRYRRTYQDHASSH